MLCKFLLTVNGVIFDLENDCIKNWDSICYSIKRSDYTGVVRSFSSSFEFTNKAYKLLLQEYLTRYLYSDATIAVYVADEEHVYRDVYAARLDFSTMKVSDTVLTINSFDDTIAAILKANKGTKYEYLVSELKESAPLNYDHLQMTNKGEWIISTDSESNSLDISVTDKGFFTIPMYLKNSEIFPRNIELTDIQQGLYSEWEFYYQDKPYFFKNDTDEVLYISFKASFELTFNAATDEDRIALMLWNPNGFPLDVWSMKLNTYQSLYNVIIDETLLVVNPGCSLCLYLNMRDDKQTTHSVFNVTSEPVITFTSRSSAESIDIIKPVVLLNKLLYSMNGNKEGIVGEIVAGDSRLDIAHIVAAESARGFENAKVYTSYTNFCKWMESVFGFVPVISGNTVTFMHRDSLFGENEPVEVSKAIDNFQMSVQDSLIYSSLRIGYEKVDYESVNGVDEFRWASEYSTGVTMNDNKQELISPYRADAYGIEFLVQKRGEETTDNESDKDLFFVGAVLVDSSYTLVREGYVISGIIAPGAMFNVMYSPKSMIEANRRFIGVGVKTLQFASSDGNSDVIINGVAETTSVEISDPLFTVAEVSFRDASSIDSEANIPVKITHNGHTYVGYLKERSCKYGRYDGMEHTLIVKSIV